MANIKAFDLTVSCPIDHLHHDRRRRLKILTAVIARRRGLGDDLVPRALTSTLFFV